MTILVAGELYRILFAWLNIRSPTPMPHDALTFISFDNGISVMKRFFALSSVVGKNGAPGSECRKKSPDKTPHAGQVLAKYFSLTVFEKFTLNVGTLFRIYERTSSGSS